ALIPTLKSRRIALGRCAGDYFILMTGVGIDASAIEKLDLNLKSWLGSVAYWLAAFRCWFAGRFASFSVCACGRLYTCTFAVVGRVRKYGGSPSVTRNARLLRDYFDVCLFPGRTRLDYLRYLVGVLSGLHYRFSDVTNFTATRVEISSELRVPV